MAKRIPVYEVRPQTPCPFCFSMQTEMTYWTSAKCSMCGRKIPVIQKFKGWKDA